jgi:hypothetical protein
MEIQTIFPQLSIFQENLDEQHIEKIRGLRLPRDLFKSII